MVILGFSDGHVERFPELSGKDIPQVGAITILDPEEIELLEIEGLSLEVGYADPRKETN